jgi:hypothetical protein
MVSARPIRARSASEGLARDGEAVRIRERNACLRLGLGFRRVGPVLLNGRTKTRAALRRLLALAVLTSFATAAAVAQVDITTQPADAVAQAAIEARRWVAEPAREQQIEAYAPALDLRAREYERPRPLRAWIAKVDLSHPDVRFIATDPARFEGEDKRFETRCATTLEFAQRHKVQLAINASAFDPFRPRAGLPMDVVGLAAVDGRVYSEARDPFGAMFITRDSRVSLKGPPLPLEDLWLVVPGFRLLLDDRRIVVPADVADSDFGGVNPRTAVGVDREGRTLWIVVVDGRQAGVSEGITLVELACLFESLGAWDALNLDGGGSTTLVLQDAEGGHDVINTPVGRGPPDTLRQVANNLGLRLPGRGPVAPTSPRATARTVSSE